jgi:hypothetical protein
MPIGAARWWRVTCGEELMADGARRWTLVSGLFYCEF